MATLRRDTPTLGAQAPERTAMTMTSNRRNIQVGATAALALGLLGIGCGDNQLRGVVRQRPAVAVTA